MARKKIVFVIVEGPSDEEALGVLLTRLFDSNAVYVHVMHCDITTEVGVNPSNIVAKIGNTVKDFAGRTFKSGDFSQIIHITDTDGVFVPNEAVVEDVNAIKPLYSETEIRTQRKSGIEYRNRCKRDNLNRLSSVACIWNVPYRIYYMSCNLDHVLYGKLNSTDEEKENDAFLFAKKYRDNIPKFLEFISESDFSVCDDFVSSWAYIRQELHSLERHTNLGLCFTPNLIEIDLNDDNQNR